MTVIKSGFSPVIPDNESNYFSLLSGAIEAVDEVSILTITKNPHDYHFRLSPSHHRYVNILIKEILKVNNIFGIRIEMSKSIKENGAISFSLTTN